MFAINRKSLSFRLVILASAAIFLILCFTGTFLSSASIERFAIECHNAMLTTIKTITLTSVFHVTTSLVFLAIIYWVAIRAELGSGILGRQFKYSTVLYKLHNHWTRLLQNGILHPKVF